MVDVEQAQPALLAEGEANGAAEFDQFRFAEVTVHAFPETVIGFSAPDYGFSISECGLLTFTVIGRFFKIHQIIDLCFLQSGLLAFDRALVAAKFANHRARHIEPANFLDGVIEYAVAEHVVPGIGKEPEACRHMRAHRCAFRARRAFYGAAFHLRAHFRGHFIQRDVAYALFGHDDSPPVIFRF